MAQLTKGDRSHLFMVRLHTDKRSDGSTLYRGRVHHIPSGEIRHFRSWEDLIEFLTDETILSDDYPSLINPKGA